VDELIEQWRMDLFDPGVRLADVTESVLAGPMVAAGFALRPQQVRFSRAVADRIEGGGPLAVEAPCGSGKSLGYLVPGILGILRRNVVDGGRHRMVVSTAAIQLQQQLVDQDVPALSRATGIEITAQVLKGRSNYACLQRIDDELSLATPDRSAVASVKGWLDAGGSGDRDDYGDPRVWPRVSVNSDECLKGQCPRIRDCYAEAARNRAQSAAIVVCNHWYLAVAGASLATDRTTLLVVDELHDLEEALRSAGSSALRDSTARHWERVLSAALPDGTHGSEVSTALRDVVGAGEAARQGTGERQQRLRDDWVKSEAGGLVRQASAALHRRASQTSDPVDAAKVTQQGLALERLAGRVERMLSPGTEHCAWADSTPDGRPEVRVAPIMPTVPGAWRTVVGCSATLGNSPASVLRDSLPGVRINEMILPSPWPIDTMAVAIVPDGPDPSDRGQWESWVDRSTEQFARELGGGVLVLATSLGRARAIATHLRMSLPVDVRCQGEAGRTELVEWFRGDRDGVLVGSRSLFQGVDVPGDALRGVVIDRVPFPSPGEPMEQAITERMSAAGRNAFAERSIARAVALLRQAAGRLIRSPTDRGAVMLTDPRALRARWGSQITGAFAPMPVSRDIADAGRLWRGEPLGLAQAQLVAPSSRRVRR
jgi:ATP-dependent DNA helicase DinG